jgi:peptidoglycan/LPS O-acetylase OafA/YrhL
MTERRKFASLQAGRGIAALMVVLCHIGAFVGVEPGLWRKAEIYRWLSAGAYGVDFFFILSGTVILLAHSGDISKAGIGRSQPLVPFLWKRFRRVYPIYWIFLIPTVLKQLHVDNGYAATQRNPYVLLSSFTLIHIRSLGFNLLPSWTLFHEILFYLVFATLLLNRKLGWIVCTCWFGASFFFFNTDALFLEPARYLDMLFSPFHLLFAFGLIVGWMLEARRGPTRLWVLLLGLAVYAAGLAVEISTGDRFPIVRILAGAGLALALLTAAEREHIQKFHIPRLLYFLGDASYSIYLSHFLAVSFIARKGFQLDRAWHLNIAVWMLAMFVAAVLVGVLVHLLIERPLLAWLDRLWRRHSPKPANGPSLPAYSEGGGLNEENTFP